MFYYKKGSKRLIDYWKEVLKIVLSEGEIIKHQGYILRELTDLVIMINGAKLETREEEIRDFHKKELIEFMSRLWQDKNFKGELGFSYAKRLYNYQGLDQLQKVSELLTYLPYSKSAVITLNNPLEDDSRVAASPPCVSILDFKLREGIVNMKAYFRSWDVGKKFYLDMLYLSEIQKQVTKKTKTQVGNITCFISSAHIYKEDLDKVKKVLAYEGGWSE